MSRTSSKSQAKTFRALVEPFNGNGVHWLIAHVPFNVKERWGTRGALSVQVLVNGIEYRTALLPTGAGEHYFIVNKKVQKAALIRAGSIAQFTIAPDTTPRILSLPPELERALNEDRAVRKWFDGFSYSARKWFVNRVANAKSPATRRSRAERIAEQLLEAMEAEQELPPIMRLVFSRHPGAERGWRELTENQRRGHLFGIFQFRDPQSRIRRIEKMIEHGYIKVRSSDRHD